MSFSSAFQARVLPWVSCIEWSCCLRPSGLQKHPYRVRVLNTKVSDPQRTIRSNQGFGSKPSCKEKGICGKEGVLVETKRIWKLKRFEQVKDAERPPIMEIRYPPVTATLNRMPVSASSELTRSVVVWFGDQFCFNFHSAALSLLTFQDISTFCKDRQEEKGWARLSFNCCLQSDLLLTDNVTIFSTGEIPGKEAIFCFYV